ncbi:MAG TPA: NAD(P)-dependent oxidoreductase [Bacteroidota bacterium]|nr:NAD(P)-dependent oxidoreductase [Bacteroidota bacterium]
MHTAAKLTADQYEKNFSELHTALTKNQAVAEANRCLFCYDSPCMKACPTHIDISTFIKKIASGNVKGSAKTILESNWIALTCAKACPVEVLCEGACVYNARGERPIEIGRLQRYTMDWYFGKGMPQLFTPAAPNGKSVGIIGSGPAGLACGAELALLGYAVTMYEGRNAAGGLDSHGIAPYKTTTADSLNEVKLVEGLGVVIRTNATIGKTIPIRDLEQRHNAIFIGIGLGLSPDLSIPGENLSGVCDALEFIERVTSREWKSVDVGQTVAVVGGGNTAIDAATEAIRLGAERVLMIYRRSREEMSAYDFEFELAKIDGVEFHFLTAPKRILGAKQVEGLECVRMKLGPPDAKGKPAPIPIPNSEFTIPVDMVIKAIGQRPADHLFSQITNLKIHGGKIAVDQETLQTSNPKYFAGGDCINGGKEVVNAAADGKKAAHGIHKVLFPR